MSSFLREDSSVSPGYTQTHARTHTYTDTHTQTHAPIHVHAHIVNFTEYLESVDYEGYFE